jgi:uncharacterized protein YqeY
MELLERIKKDRTTARKSAQPSDKVRATLLTTLVGEADTALKGKQADKFDMLALVKKFQSNCLMTLEIKQDEKTYSEFCILEEYIPKQLTEEKLYEILLESEARSVGQFFGYLNSKYKGLFDGQLASEVAKGHL